MSIYGNAPITAWTQQSWNLAACRVPRAWKNGFSGSGVKVGVADDGVDRYHPDLSNVNTTTSAGPGGASPYPEDSSETHATAVAGIIGGKGAKEVCGIAYGCSLVSLKVLAATGTEAERAQLYTDAANNQTCDIINNSWGPTDAGGIVSPTTFQDYLTAFATCATTGRGGKGILLPFSAGNGYAEQTNAAWDPLQNSRYTITVGAINRTLTRSAYSEIGGCLLCCAPGGNDGSTDGSEGCVTCQSTVPFGTSNISLVTTYFNGTSAACPHVSGILALLLERHSTLTWRDCKELIAQNSRIVDSGNENWIENGAGRWYNPEYGFGMLDAALLTWAASSFTPLGTEQTSSFDSGTVSIPIATDGTIYELTITTVTSTFTMEEAMFTVTFTGDDQTDLSITLVSPSNTESILVVGTTITTDIGSYTSFPLKAETFRGESSNGIWKAKIKDNVAGGTQSTLTSYILELFGH